MIESILLWVFALLTAPFFAGVIFKVKAFFGGRKGSPVMINYYTLVKLFKKGSVYSTSTTFVFKLGPMIGLAAAATALLFLPMAGHSPVLSFDGDVIFILYLLGLARFFTIAAAMDTASPFEGMGAAREAYFPILCEASMFMILILFYRLTGELTFTAYLAGDQPAGLWQSAGSPLLFIVIALFIVLLTENARVPVDDPATHLELTMIHEVMVLDHSGPDFGLIEMGAFLKLFFYSSIVARLVFPFELGNPLFDLGLFSLGVLLVVVAVGVVESVMARYRMDRVPKFVLTSFALAFFATVITLEFLEMIHPVDTILSLALLSILFSFGSSRLPILIKILAFQGLVVGIVPLFMGHDMSTGGIVFTIVTLSIRGIIIPGCIHVAIKRVAIGREVEPIVGYHASVLAGLLLIVGATVASHRFDMPYSHITALLLPTAIALLGAGMFMLMARRNAIAMVLGYIMMENGIYLVGTTFSTRARHIVEFGILLDVLAGVMIMAVILQNIKQTFDDVDTARLRTLKE